MNLRTNSNSRFEIDIVQAGNPADLKHILMSQSSLVGSMERFPDRAQVSDR